MNGLLLAFLSLTAVGSEDLDGLRTEAESTASAVAEARRSGARRAEIARLMRAYRAAAEALADAEARTNAPTDATSEAIAALVEALATGKRGDDHRAALEAAIGPPATRLQALTEALPTATALESNSVRTTLLRDLAEESGTVELMADWDAWATEQERRRLEARLAALNRVVPGQTGGVEDALEAQRIEESLRELGARRDAHLALRDAARSLATRALQALEPE